MNLVQKTNQHCNKMKLNSILALAVAVLALAGCSSTPTRVDSGTIHGRTFNFVNRGDQPSPDYADNRQAIHEMIQNAITKNLAVRGVTRVQSGGDLTVGYLIIIGNNATTEAINDYFGYREGANELHEIAHDAYTSKSPNYFEAGTLVIDVIDNKNHKLVKRNYGTETIIRNLSPEERAERIQEVVDQILRGTTFEP
jgi:hypothetical protein